VEQPVGEAFGASRTLLWLGSRTGPPSERLSPRWSYALDTNIRPPDGFVGARTIRATPTTPSRAETISSAPLENLEISERTRIILLSFSSPMLSPLTALFATLSSVFRSRSALQLENLALRHQIGVLQRAAKKRPKLRLGTACCGSGCPASGAVGARRWPSSSQKRSLPVLDVEGAAWATGTTRRFSRGSRPSSQDVPAESELGCTPRSR
jgi:hypothetical protein